MNIIRFEEDKHLSELFELFDKYHLYIAGMTPIICNGPDGRPLEIRNLYLANISAIYRHQLTPEVMKTSDRELPQLVFKLNRSPEYWLESRWRDGNVFESRKSGI